LKHVNHHFDASQTAAGLLVNAEKLQIEPLTMLERVCEGTVAAKPASLRQSLRPFVDAIQTLRRLADIVRPILYV
jgi:hypothetical protein